MPTLSVGELVWRIVLATVLGGAVGIERELSDQPAGFRTHMLVSLGAALFTLAGAYGLGDFRDSGIQVRFDPTRIAAQVVTGIGFLGAGAILRRGVNVRGLTTAAALWVTAAIGTAVGLGFISGAVGVTIAALAALYGFKFIERYAMIKFRKGQTRYLIEANGNVEIAQIQSALEDAGCRFVTMRSYHDDEESWQLVVVANTPSSAAGHDAERRLTALDGVSSVEVDL
jgi:putative Mg2+ transporter-C (MgtC) family protein